MNKKVLGTALATCLLVPSVFGLTGCGASTDRTMSMSINPEASFVVDKNDKIVSVIFENEDAGKVYASVNFEGMTVEDAVEVFIERATISGFYTVDGQEITVEVSGSKEKDVEKLENVVKKEAEKTYGELGINVTVDFSRYKGEALHLRLVDKVKVLYPEKSEEELKAMEDKELIALIKSGYEQYKGLAYDQVQDIMEVFNNVEQGVLKAVADAQAGLKSAKDKVAEYEERLANTDETSPLYAGYRSALEFAQTGLTTAETLLNTAIQSYQTAKAQAIETAKAAYAQVKAQLVTAYNTILTNAETAYNTAITNGTLTLTEEQKANWDAIIAEAKAEVTSAQA